jgi:CubicO group peptidase (beta-lactamase class C family)
VQMTTRTSGRSIVWGILYLFRVLCWGERGVLDYQKFPGRKLKASSLPFHFATSPDETRVRTLCEAAQQIDDLDAFLATTGTQAFIVIQGDAILYERYFNGANRDTIVTSFSVAKSFTSALVGIAIAEGCIHSASDPITRYLPELAHRDSRFSRITIRHLLTMSSGIKYGERPFLNSGSTKTYYYPDLRRLALYDTQIIDPPGMCFLYNNYNPLLLGMILERATGTPVATYLQEKIWEPIGMEYSGSWSLDSDASGFEKMESGINARAIDFAKFGRLYLRNGTWDGIQVIPAGWVAESTQMNAPVSHADHYYPDDFFFSDGQGYYQYMWWGMRRSERGYDFFAMGRHGQFTYVSPHANLIIVRNGEQLGIDAGRWVHMFYTFAGMI